MQKKANGFINIFMGCSIGVFFGYWLFTYLDYRANPGLYEIQSAPWYLGIQLWGIVLAFILLGCIATKLVIRHREKQ